MHRRPRDCNSSQKSVLHPTTPYKHTRSHCHCMLQIVPMQPQGLGTQAHHGIQEAYQRRLTSGTITLAQGGFTQNNRFSGLTRNDNSDDDTAETIAGTINSHMANLTAQTAATINDMQRRQTNFFSNWQQTQCNYINNKQ